MCTPFHLQVELELPTHASGEEWLCKRSKSKETIQEIGAPPGVEHCLVEQVLHYFIFVPYAYKSCNVKNHKYEQYKQHNLLYWSVYEYQLYPVPH